MSKKLAFGLSGTVVALSGCAVTAPSWADTPEADSDGLEAQQLITNVNADGTWTAYAVAPYEPDRFGEAVFTGPAGKTRKMGVCLLRRAGLPSSPIACSDASTCPAPPSGGYSYCTAPNGVGQKYCYNRMGVETTYCAGTPALGGTPIAPGSYTTPASAVIGTYISYACFEGCKESDPSSSSPATYFATAKCEAFCGM